jgi:hypothetical protein
MMEQVISSTGARDPQVFEVRKHLASVAATLRNRSRDSLSLSLARKLRRLASLLDAATPSICVCVEAVPPRTENRGPRVSQSIEVLRAWEGGPLREFAAIRPKPGDSDSEAGTAEGV